MEDGRVSVNARAWPLVERLATEAGPLRLGVSRRAGGVLVIDAGIQVAGSLEAGRRIAEIALGGLGTVTLEGGAPEEGWPFGICVHASQPVTACLLAQYAGWAFTPTTMTDGPQGLMVSGPGRARVRREPLFAELGYADEAPRAVFLVETAAMPEDAVLAELAAASGTAPEKVAVILTPTTSSAGLVQVVARVLEVALHKVHELRFPLDRIREGLGRAPLPPPAPDTVTAMGRANDAILLGGEVWLWVDGPEDEARALAAALPSTTSPAWGRPFAEIFREAGGDFYAIDRALFAPARVVVTATATGRSFAAGRIDRPLLERAFALEQVPPELAG